MNDEVKLEELVESQRVINIGGSKLVLINEKDQVINDVLELTFKTESTLSELDEIFSTKTLLQKIYVKDSDVRGIEYVNYVELLTLEKKWEGDGIFYKVKLKKNESMSIMDIPQLKTAMEVVVASFTDEQALQCISLHRDWYDCVGKKLEKGVRIQCDGKLYRTRQEIKEVLSNQKPGVETASLYEVIEEQHEGTVDDPIPYDQMMEVFKDKYYLEDGILYKCIRDSGQPLYASCKSLVGNYFEIVE